MTRPDAERLRCLERYGLRDLAVIYRNWQQFGYRNRQPSLYPADPSRGRNQLFRQLVEQAQEFGWLFALREEYASITPDSPYWDPKVTAKASDGKMRPLGIPTMKDRAMQALHLLARNGWFSESSKYMTPLVDEKTRRKRWSEGMPGSHTTPNH